MSTIVQQGGHKRTRPDSSSEDETESELNVEESLERVPLIERGFRVPLIEVFSVCILNLPETGSHIYGTITITDGAGSQYIYNRKRDESEFICPDDSVLLTGPPYCIFALDAFYMDVDLRDKDSAYDTHPHHDVIRDPWCLSDQSLVWDPRNYITNVFEEALYIEIESKHFSVGVTFIVFRNAVEATVNVKLIIPDPKSTPKVFGSITAGNCNFSEESVLFQRAAHEHIDVRPGELIPLSRSVVPVPLNSVLIVQANLFDHDAISSGGYFAKGSAKFPANLPGTSFVKRIRGQGIEIQVEVTWIENRYLHE